MERETRGLDDSKPDVPAFEPLPISLHPHYPFVLIDQMLGQETSPLVTLWILRPESRCQLVARWCDMAKSHYWAWNQCDELREYLIRTNQKIQRPLRRLKQRPRPTGRSRPKVTAEYFLLDEIARLLIDGGYSSPDAQLAIGLAIAKDPTDDSAVEAALKKVQRARARSRTEMPQ